MAKKYDFLNPQLLDDVATGLSSTLEEFAKHFKTTTHPVSQKAFSYIRGLFKSEKKSRAKAC